MLSQYSLISDNEQIIIIPSLACEVGIGKAALLGFLYESYKQGKSFFSTSILTQSYSVNKPKTIAKYITELMSEGYIVNYELSPKNKYKIVCDKTPSISNAGSDKCEWCGSITLVLNEHHYPVPKKDGGVDIVKICPNCHYEYHSLKYVLKLSDEILFMFQEVERRYYEE